MPGHLFCSCKFKLQLSFLQITILTNKDLVSKYDIHFKYWHTSVADALMQCVSIDHEDLVADIGAGTGEIAHQFGRADK